MNIIPDQKQKISQEENLTKNLPKLKNLMRIDENPINMRIKIHFGIKPSNINTEKHLNLLFNTKKSVLAKTFATSKNLGDLLCFHLNLNFKYCDCDTFQILQDPNGYTIVFIDRNQYEKIVLFLREFLRWNIRIGMELPDKILDWFNQF